MVFIAPYTLAFRLPHRANLFAGHTGDFVVSQHQPLPRIEGMAVGQ